MINAKERFGYTYIITANKEEQKVFEAFCEGKGELWKCFFGWRRTVGNTRYYWIPTKKLEILNEILLDK